MRVRVCVRTRPTQNFAQENIFVDIEHATIKVKNTNENEKHDTSVLNNRQNTFSFKYDYVFHNASQSAVYDLYVRDCVHGVVNGTNGSIMSYGQTGSGKTFTMLGDAQSYEHRGIAPRAISQLFSEINSRVEMDFMVTCTYLEIYNERIYDLLGDLNKSNSVAMDYTIAEERDGRGVFVRGLAEIEVKVESDALNLLFSGGLARTIATHKLNKRSNRSHSIFTLYVQQRQRSGVSEKIMHSKLHLIDLAGSERLKKTMENSDGTVAVDEVTKKESMAINQSLTYLEQCVVALARKSAGAGGSLNHIPYRQSKLTNILKDCLGANCNTVMVACIWGERSHLEESISTLRLASRMMRVTNETNTVETIDTAVLVKKQEKIIAALKQELLMHDALIERTGMVYDPFTPEQQQQLADDIERYVEAEEREEEGILQINSYRQMLELCKQFKKKLLAARAAALNNNGSFNNSMAFNNTFSGNMTGGGGGDMAGGGEGEQQQQVNNAMFQNAPVKSVGVNIDAASNKHMFSGNKVGGLAASAAFNLGEAKADSRPLNGIEISSQAAMGNNSPGNKSNYSPSASAYSPPPSPFHNSGNNVSQAKATQPRWESGKTAGFDADDSHAMQTFVQTDFEGQKLFALFSTQKEQRSQMRSQAKQMTQQLNDLKASIEASTRQLQEKKQQQQQQQQSAPPAKGKKDAKGVVEDMVDDEEMRLAKVLKDSKQNYRDTIERFQQTTQNIDMLSKELDALRSNLAAEFNRFQAQQQFGGSYHPVGKGSNTNNNTNVNAGGSRDALDDQEAFDELERQRVLNDDPDSMAFFLAQKTRRANLTQSGTALKSVQKNKRYG